MKLHKSNNTTEHDTGHLEFLIGLIAQGSQDALALFYEKTNSAVFSFLLSYLGWHDAQDAMQETFLTVYEAAGRYTAKGTPLPWLFGIAKNTALMKLRSSKRETTLPEESWLAVPAEEPQVTGEDRMVLESLLTRLSPEEYRIVVFHAVSGLKFREISSILSLPLSTVLSKYNRSMKKLKKAWEEDTDVE